MHNTSAEYLYSILTPSDQLSVSSDGKLKIEDCPASDLIENYGSPLYVVSENTLRLNYHNILDAVSSLWPAPVNIMYAIKANNTPAIRAIFNQLGAGGDCFGLGELHATFAGGAHPDKIAMNGNYKSYDELIEGVKRGIVINIDSTEEIEDLKHISIILDKVVKVNLRLKVVSSALNSIGSDYFGISSGLGDFIAKEKWGFSYDMARELTREIQNFDGFEFLGYTTHLGRFTRSPQEFSEYMKDFVKMAIQLASDTGVKIKLLDLGGGWPRQRDPESRLFSINRHTIHDYVAAVIHQILPLIQEAGLEVPELWLEPGRYLVGNAVTLLGRVGAIKRDTELTWITVDFSTNNIMRIDTSGSAYHVVACEDMHKSFTEEAEIVGPTCTWSIIASDWNIPDLKRGSPLAVLDVGMYAETASTQFNGVPRPATVLVDGGTVEIIKERETVNDVFRKCRMPERLKA